MKRKALFQGVRRGALAGFFALAACSGGTEQPKDPPLPADPVGSSSPTQGAAVGELDRGKAFVDNKKYEEAKAHLEKAIQTHPSADAHFYMGLAQEGLKDKKGAEESYKEALKLDPKAAGAAQNLAALYLGDPPRPDEAIAVLKAANAKVPGDGQIIQNLAYAYSLKGDITNASAQYEAALKLGEDAQIRFAYGDMFFEAKQMEKAAEQFKKALEGVKEDAPLLVTVGRKLGFTKSYAECVKAFDRAIKIKATDPEWFVRRGVCRHGLNDDAGAQADYQEAIKVDPKFADAHYYLGVAYREQKQRAKAIAELEQAAKLGAGTPVGKIAKEKLNELTKK